MEPANTYLQAIQVMALAAIGAWVAIHGRRIDANTSGLQKQLDDEKKRCDGLEKRVRALERMKRSPPKPRPKK